MTRILAFALTTLAVVATALAADARPVAGGPPPSPFTIDWPGTPATSNPLPGAHALALFDEDAWNRASVCPLTRSAAQPAAPGLLRCNYTEVATLAVGGGELWLGVAPERHEHDGMYAYTENVVIVIGGGSPRVAHTLVQWSHHVPDCFAEVQMRRQRVVDLDGDGVTELCIESLAERGGGLFQVMNLEEQHQRWYPAERSRGFSAWSLEPGAGRLARRSTLDERCPRTGYRPFVPTRPHADPLGWRARVQGRDRAGQAIGARLVERADAGCGWEREPIRHRAESPARRRTPGDGR